MIGALLTFCFLFLLIKVFERERDDLDGFAIGTVAVVPILALVIVNVVLLFAFPESPAPTVVGPMILVAMTFGLLWKNLDIPVWRSAAYTAAVVAFNIGMAVIFAADR